MACQVPNVRPPGARIVPEGSNGFVLSSGSHPRFPPAIGPFFADTQSTPFFGNSARRLSWFILKCRHSQIVSTGHPQNSVTRFPLCVIAITCRYKPQVHNLITIPLIDSMARHTNSTERRTFAKPRRRLKSSSRCA